MNANTIVGVVRAILTVCGHDPDAGCCFIFKRLFIPEYEKVRFLLIEAGEAQIYQPNTVPGYPHIGQIEDILWWVDPKRAT